MKMKTQPVRTYGTQKTVQRGKFISMSAYFKNTERSQKDNKMLHLKLLEKQEQEFNNTSKTLFTTTK
jgi:hypothetical protein